MGLLKLAVVGGAAAVVGGNYVFDNYIKEKIPSISVAELRQQGIQDFRQLASENAGEQMTLENCQNATVAFSEGMQGQEVTIDHPTLGSYVIHFSALENFCPGFFSDQEPQTDM